MQVLQHSFTQNRKLNVKSGGAGTLSVLHTELQSDPISRGDKHDYVCERVLIRLHFDLLQRLQVNLPAQPHYICLLVHVKLTRSETCSIRLNGWTDKSHLNNKL